MGAFVAIAVMATGCDRCTKKRERLEYESLGAKLGTFVEELRPFDAVIRPPPSELANSLSGDPRAQLARNVTMARGCIAAKPAVAKISLTPSEFAEPPVREGAEAIVAAANAFGVAVKVCEAHGDLVEMECPLKCVPAWNALNAAFGKVHTEASSRGVTTPVFSRDLSNETH
ncbi:MAG: hypothetical protein U0169_18680 [Polyangiaceae bacterium]